MLTLYYTTMTSYPGPEVTLRTCFLIAYDLTRKGSIQAYEHDTLLPHRLTGEKFGELRPRLQAQHAGKQCSP